MKIIFRHHLVFLLEAEHSCLLLDVDLLQILPHLHNLGEMPFQNTIQEKCSLTFPKNIVSHLALPLLVQLHLRRSGSTCLFDSLCQLFHFPDSNAIINNALSKETELTDYYQSFPTIYLFCTYVLA